MYMWPHGHAGSPHVGYLQNNNVYLKGYGKDHGGMFSALCGGLGGRVGQTRQKIFPLK